MLYRKIQPYIEDYLKSDSNKVLIIDGARQIGKTFIIRHVGQQLFENYIELNFAEDQNGPKLFEQVRTVRDFYFQVSTIAGEKIPQAGRQVHLHCQRLFARRDIEEDELDPHRQH